MFLVLVYSGLVRLSSKGSESKEPDLLSKEASLWIRTVSKAAIRLGEVSVLHDTGHCLN